MVLVSVFFMNLLCAMVPCDPANSMPEIDGMRGGSGGGGFFRGKRLISGGGEDYPVVETRNGGVKGFPMMVMSGRRIFAFEGIPYATAGRFQDPVPAKNWTGIRKAFSPGSYCLQIHPGKMLRVFGSENCLTINVYSPKIPASEHAKKLPVIAFIHGGSFTFGSGTEFGPSYLLANDVVLVNFNYRVGVLGFMSTGDDNSPGNYGLKDQQLALKWISENVENFGGDKDRVTLMGQSAGSVSVHLHMLNPTSQKYFHRTVLLSGTAHNHWGLQNTTKSLKLTRALAKWVNCGSTKSTQEIVSCFKKIDPNWLVAAQMNLFDWIPFPPVLFAPVIEHAESPSPFIAESPTAISQSGREAKIPAIFQMTKQEGFMSSYAMNGMMKIGGFRNAVKKYLPFYLDYDYVTRDNLPLQRNITERILAYYNITNVRNAPMTAYGEMGTDRMFSMGVSKGVKLHARIAPTFASLFSFFGKYNQGKFLGVPGDELGVAHTEDLYYYFNASLYLPGFKQHDKEAELSRIMVNLLTNFVSMGEPLYTDKKSGEDHRIWDAVSPTDEEYQLLQLDRDVEMVDDPFVDRKRFWDSLNLKDTIPLVLPPFNNNEIATDGSSNTTSTSFQ